jgi:hypothetical protein
MYYSLLVAEKVCIAKEVNLLEEFKELVNLTINCYEDTKAEVKAFYADINRDSVRECE